jgi:enoyl-CoA hydratase/carnithine racemase
MYDDLRYELDDGIATIILDRPAVHNAFREQTIDELNNALERFADDDGAYVAILTGADGGFCAGADVSEMPDWSAQSKAEYAEFLENVQNVVRRLRGPKPTVAAVGGPAIGAGCDFALGCDVRFVGPDAVMRQGFVNVGLVPGDGGAWLLPRLIGDSKARQYLLTGRDITPEDAVDLGLAVDVADDAVTAATEFGEELRTLPALAVRYTNQLVDSNQTFDEYCERAIDFQWECVNDPEHEEAVRAFREKRDPAFDRTYSSKQ